ncbi:2-methylaconitate cis-trans isomerase PrpF [Pigmentiphaga soli]|uniref:2-methylaconitate cis-trans isomerase PrpF n=1 Tax=Pigmentiphaga soli TaxID=1007095 RepID=A0ABP8H6D2_9BURK
MAELKIPAAYMRGGASQGVFFNLRDLPRDPAQRDRLLLRVLGGPDPAARRLDGLAAGAVALVGASRRDDADVDYLYGRPSPDRASIDWSGDDGHLAAAVGPFALRHGLVAPRDGTTVVRIWQGGVGRRMAAHVEVRAGQVLEAGAFVEDGIPFPCAEIRLDFLDEPARAILPTANAQDRLRVDGVGELAATLAVAGLPAVFVRAADLGLTGRERPDAVRRDAALQARLEAVRGAGAAAMGARGRAEGPPVLAWVAPPAAYRTAGGDDVAADRVDVLARIFADGRLQAEFGTGAAISLAAAAALPGTVVSQVARTLPGVAARIGHAGGVQTVGAAVARQDHGWVMEHATVSRSARCLMSGWIHVPAEASGLV